MNTKTSAAIGSGSLAPPAVDEGIDSWRGWIAAGAGFLALSAAFGATYSFGTFVVPIGAELGASKSALGWVFSIATFLYLLLGVYTGSLCDRFGPRYLIAAGAVFVGGGFAATGFVASVELAYLTFGVCLGLGLGCVFVPAIASVGGWFVRHRGKAVGLVASGVGVGTLIAAPVAAVAIETYGWRQAAVIMGSATALLLLIAAAAIAKPPTARAGQAGPWRLADLFRDRRFQLLYANGLTFGLALFVPFVFLVPFAQHIGISGVQAAGLLGAVGAASALARLLFGGVGDWLGVLRAYKLAAVLFAVSFAIWLAADSYAALIAVALALGAGYGGINALAPAVLANFFGRERLGAAMGALYTSGSVGALLGAPLAGLIIGGAGRYQTATWVFFGVALLSVLALLPLRSEVKPGG